MKLKTLKDITPIPNDMEVDTWTSTRALKEEAIKRVKYYRKRRDKVKKDYGGDCNGFWIFHRLQQEFMDFFNITEDNLQ